MSWPSRQRGWVLVLAGALLIPAGAAPGQTGWWNFKWPYRRTVTVTSVPRTGLPGEEVAVVRMPTGGKLAVGASDLRVVTPRGTVLPHRVLMTGRPQAMASSKALLQCSRSDVSRNKSALPRYDRTS